VLDHCQRGNHAEDNQGIRPPRPAVAALLSGCVVGGENARHDMEVSKEAYKTCLATQSPELCEGEWRTYEADLSAYRATPRIVIGAGRTQPLTQGYISGGGNGGLGGSASGEQTVFSPHECIGAVVNGQCYGSILPDYSRPHATCYGQMINGVCTGPMF